MIWRSKHSDENLACFDFSYKFIKVLMIGRVTNCVLSSMSQFV